MVNLIRSNINSSNCIFFSSFWQGQYLWRNRGAFPESRLRICHKHSLSHRRSSYKPSCLTPLLHHQLSDQLWHSCCWDTDPHTQLIDLQIFDCEAQHESDDVDCHTPTQTSTGASLLKSQQVEAKTEIRSVKKYEIHWLIYVKSCIVIKKKTKRCKTSVSKCWQHAPKLKRKCADVERDMFWNQSDKMKLAVFCCVDKFCLHFLPWGVFSYKIWIFLHAFLVCPCAFMNAGRIHTIL